MTKRAWAAAAAALLALAVAAPAMAGSLIGGPAAGGTLSQAAPAPAAGTRLPGGARLDDLLEQQLASTPDTTPMRLFVHGASLESARAAVRTAGLRTAFELPTIGVIAADGLPPAIRSLFGLQGLTYLEADAPITYELDHTHEATRGEEARTAYASTAGVPTDVDGTGITVAVIDSGVDGTHPFFTRPDGTSKVRVNLRMTCEEVEVLAASEGTCAAAGQDGMFVAAPGNDSDTMANGGHGTHVAGIVAGVDTDLGDRTLHGAAPGSDLVVLGTGRTLVISAAVPALQWVLDNHADPCGDGSCAPVRVINNSWSGPKEYDAEDVVNKLQRALIDEGVTVVWAASNDGGDGTTLQTSAYASEPQPGAISVANYDDANTGTRDGSLNASSSRGLRGNLPTYPDVSAPGTAVLSSCRLTLPICATGLDFVADGDYNSISGTSMAAPHVAGIVAQLLQVDPDLTPAEIEDILEDTAFRFVAGGAYEEDAVANPGTLTSFDKGHGLVDVVAALGRVLGVPAPGLPADCVADGPNLTDPSGDATSVLGLVQALPNEPSLDVLGLTIDDDGTDLTTIIEVDDLGEAIAPSAGEGEYYETYFTHAGRQFFLSAERASDGTETYELGYFNTTREGVAPATGAFDAEADTITVTVPLAATFDDAGSIPALSSGTVVTSIQVITRRHVGPTILDADTAPSACAYTVGLGNGSPPPPDTGGDEETPDATLTKGGTAYEWSGSVTTGFTDPTGALGLVGFGELFLSGDAAVTKLVEVAEDGTLTIDVAADTPLADFDLYVLDMAGNEVAHSATESATEHVSIEVPFGRYRVIVRSFAAVEATFTAVAELA